MRLLIKDDKGVVAIVMAILIPVILFGVLTIYAMLDKPQQENTAHKIVYASSEAYLSRYNAYLFEQMGILANLDSDVLEPLILHYLLRNKLIENHESASIEINYERLDKPSVFRETVIESSNILIGNAVVDYGVNLLDQFAFTKKIKLINDSVQNFEKKLSEQFDKSGATQILRTIKQFSDVQAGRHELDTLENELKIQYDTFYEVLDQLKAVLTLINATIDNPQQEMTAFINAKKAQWHDSESVFANEHQSYMKAISEIEVQYTLIETDEASHHQVTDEIETEMIKKPLNQDKIDQLASRRVQIEASISNRFDEIEAIISNKLDFYMPSTPSLMQLLKELLLEAEYLFSGVEIGSGEIMLEEVFKSAANDSDETDINALSLPQKVKLNEYYLSIFSSYDLNCPRVFDPQNRHNALRIIKGEAEYLVTGLQKEKQSISLVRLKIVAIRSAANLVSLLCDKDKLARISTATSVLPQPWRTLAYGAAIAAWSGVESYSDINRLMKGEGLYFLKTQAQWALDFDALLNGTWKIKLTETSSDIDGRQPPNPKPNQSPIPKSNPMDPNLYYMDYLRLLLLIQDPQTTQLRAMDLIEAELRDLTEGKTGLANLSRGHVIDLTWQVKRLFSLTPNNTSTIHMRNGFK